MEINELKINIDTSKINDKIKNATCAMKVLEKSVIDAKKAMVELCDMMGDFEILSSTENEVS